MLEVSFSNRYKDYILYHFLIQSPKWQKKTLELSWSKDYSVKTRDEEIKLVFLDFHRSLHIGPQPLHTTLILYIIIVHQELGLGPPAVGFHVATTLLLSLNTVSILNPCNSRTGTSQTSESHLTGKEGSLLLTVLG